MADQDLPESGSEPEGAVNMREAVVRKVRQGAMLRRGMQLQEMLALLGGFVLLLLMLASMITSVMHPIFPLAALVFFLYPFRKVIVPRRTMQLGIAAFMIWLFLSLSGALFPFLVALALAYILAPIVEHLEKKGIARWITSLGLSLMMLGVYALVGIFVVPGLVEQFQQLFQSASGLMKNANAFLDNNHLTSRLQDLGIPRRQAEDLVRNEIQPQIKTIVAWLFTQMGAFVKNASSILEGVINLLLIPLLTLYMLIDFKRFRTFVRTKVLRENKRYVYYLRQVDVILSSYLRGVMITSSLVGTLAVIILSIFNVPYAVVIGILTGVFNLIPSVGIFLNLGVAMIIFLFAPGEFSTNTLITAAMVAGLHALNSYVIEPRVIGHRVGLPPVLMIASLFVFAHFVGFIGLLIAVPTSAVIAMFMREWYHSTINAEPLPDS
ncbi:MAG TPA: AI-2E family transporter [Candidatus Kapabacteria bacterium]|nr:AI-2E family transporter [Candidatus Kapabacteria bacterium]